MRRAYAPLIRCLYGFHFQWILKKIFVCLNNQSGLKGCLDQPWFSTNDINEPQLLLTPVHILFLILQIFLHHVESGKVIFNSVNALAQQFNSIYRHLVVGFQKLNWILIQGLGCYCLLLLVDFLFFSYLLHHLFDVLLHVFWFCCRSITFDGLSIL